MSDSENRKTFRDYLQSNPLVHATVETLLSHLAMTANTKWQDTPQLVHSLSRRGWHIARWLPTFLIVDGPLGRFLKAVDSPLNKLLKIQHAFYPCLSQARDAFNHDLFRQVRNGVGHWSFIWEANNQDRLITLDWETGRRTADISILEAEALHLLAFSVIEAIDDEIFKPSLLS